MRRMLAAWISRYRRWRFVEEDLPALSTLPIAHDESDLVRIRRAIERGERQLADYRKNGCLTLARECEVTLGSLRTRLSALQF